jgi:hypothetical protein
MPRNTTGGSGHRSQRNSEGSKARNNRCFIDDLLDDIKNKEKLTGVHIARITRRLGCGRMEVFYLEEVVDDKKRDFFENEDDEGNKKPTKKEFREVLQTMPMRGGLRGKGKRTVWVDIDSLVMIAETGLGGKTHEIVAVFSPEQVARLRNLKPDMDERMFLKSGNAPTSKPDGFEFDEEDEDDEVDVDNI